VCSTAQTSCSPARAAGIGPARPSGRQRRVGCGRWRVVSIPSSSLLAECLKVDEADRRDRRPGLRSKPRPRGFARHGEMNYMTGDFRRTGRPGSRLRRACGRPQPAGKTGFTAQAALRLHRLWTGARRDRSWRVGPRRESPRRQRVAAGRPGGEDDAPAVMRADQWPPNLGSERDWKRLRFADGADGSIMPARDHRQHAGDHHLNA